MSNPWDNVLTSRHGTKLRPKTAATEQGDDNSDVEERARGEERQRQQDIAVACELAGRPEAASGFVSGGKSVSDVLAALVRLAAPEANDRLTPEQRYQQRLARVRG